jgi:hypothetical protein
VSIPIGCYIDEGVVVIRPRDNTDTGASAQGSHDPKTAATADDPDETIGKLGAVIGEWRPERMLRDW